ncbi:MAG: hypothetical protein Q9221_005424 [Calogaya cf. arnoldii]
MPPKRISGGPMVVVKGPEYSDGEASHRPETGNLTRANEDGYLQTLAEKWMKEELGAAQPEDTLWIDYQQATKPGSDRDLPIQNTYVLLLNGFHVLDKRSITEGYDQVDRWLFGHPDGKRFDSPNRFYPHFKYLMQHDSGEPCKCDLCGAKGGNPGPKKSVGRPAAAIKRQTRPAPLNRGPVDEEGTPDVYCSLFTLLKNERTLSRTIEERASLDWRAEKPLVQKFANVIPKQPAFIPRNGEIVLYLRPLPPGMQLQQNPKTHHFSLHDIINNRPAGTPKWLAGVVTQVPPTPPKTESLYPPSPQLPSNPDSQTEEPSLNLTGFRLEPLPSPNSPDKNLSKQHTYTPLHLIRPFAFWQLLLAGIPESSWHISIHHALIASATVSLINRSRFSGRWPNASIYSNGIFIGAESYWIGDIVRLLPSALPESLPTTTSKTEPTLLILQIRKIVTKFHSLAPEPSNPNLVTGNRCSHITLTIQGPVFTSIHSRYPANPTNLPKTMQTYNTEWFHLSHPSDTYSVPFSAIHSRLYESEALASYIPSHADPNIDIHAITDARAIAAATDERIAVDTDTDTDADEEGNTKRWFWADNRSEALDLQTVDGLEVGLYDGEREPRVWREVLGVVDGRRDGVDRGVVRGVMGDGEGSGSGSGSDEERGEEEKGVEEEGGEGVGEGGDDGGDGEREGVVEEEEENEEEEEESDDVMEIEAPDLKRARVEVKVPLRG